LALGVVGSIFFNLFQIITSFIQSSYLHLLIISAIFIFLFLFYIGFLFHIFPMTEQMQSYFKKNWITILGLLVMIIILGALLFMIPNIKLL